MRLPCTDLTATGHGTTLAILERCLRACIDAERMYAAASADAFDPVLRALFHVYERQRRGFVEALQAAIAPFVQEDEATRRDVFTVRGVLHRPRRESHRSDDAIVLDDVARAETAAARIYKTSLQCGETLPAEVHAMLVWQHEAIRNALEDVKSRAIAPRV